MSEKYYVGDLHLGHRLVAATRGFIKKDGTADVDAHDRAVIHSILSNVPQGGTLRVLGDNSANNGWEHALSTMKELTYYGMILELIYGNRDKIHAAQRGIDYTVFKKHVEVFSWMGERLLEKKWGRKLFFSHYPNLRGDDTRHREEKDELWRWPKEILKDPLAWVIHAHTHQDTLVSDLRPNHVCVSWDVNRGPVSETTLKRVVMQKERKSVMYGKANWGSLEGNRELAGQIARHEIRLS